MSKILLQLRKQLWHGSGNVEWCHLNVRLSTCPLGEQKVYYEMLAQVHLLASLLITSLLDYADVAKETAYTSDDCNAVIYAYLYLIKKFFL